MADDCLFCRIVAGEIPSTRVHEDDEVIAFRDIAPRAPTHILVIPRRHIASAADLTDADGPILGRLFAVTAQVARDAGDRGRGLPGRDQRRPVGRADGRPPAPPPDGRACVRLAARMRAATMRVAAGFALLMAIGGVVAGCAPGGDEGGAVGAPAPSVASLRPVTEAVVQTRAAIAAALGEHRLTLLDTQTPYRPAEAALLAGRAAGRLPGVAPGGPRQGPDRGLRVPRQRPRGRRGGGAGAGTWRPGRAASSRRSGRST